MLVEADLHWSLSQGKFKFLVGTCVCSRWMLAWPDSCKAEKKTTWPNALGLQTDKRNLTC
jgi:hypothetical protein